MPEAIGSSYRGRVTGTLGRASGRPSGLLAFGLPPLVAPPPVVVLLLHAARKLPAPVRANAAPPDRSRKSRRVAAKRRSFGCIVKPSRPLTDWPVNCLVCATVPSYGAVSRTVLTRVWIQPRRMLMRDSSNRSHHRQGVDAHCLAFVERHR